MDAITFTPLREQDLDELDEWHRDSELANRYGGKDGVRTTWNLMRKDSNRKFWLVQNGIETVGYVDFEEHPKDNLAWIGIAVKPVLRSKGWGKRIIQEFLLSQMARRYPEIWAGIEHDNIASRRCFESVGFVTTMTAPDAEGIFDYIYRY